MAAHSTIDLDALVRRFFERMMELRPVEASFHGLHQHDHRLPEGGLEGPRQLLDLLDGFEADLSRAESGEDPIELEAARYWAALARHQLEEIRLWARMPEAPDQIGTGIFLLFVRDYAPLEVRLESIAARLEAVPAYLQASRGQLQEPVRLWCEVALDTARGLSALFRSVAAAAPAGPLRRRLDTAAAGASHAVEEYCRWLEGEVLPRAGAVAVIGEAGFHELMRLRRLPDPPDRILELGRSALVQFRAERDELVARHWPGLSAQEVAERIWADHPATVEEALTSYGESIAEARSFVERRRLATLPAEEELLVEATPEFLQPVIPFAAYEPPARFDANQLGIYLVTPNADALGEHNRPSVLNTSVHEGYPGHHLQFACANRHPSLVRLLCADTAIELIEGWAHYSEQLMYEEGFLEGPETRFVQLLGLIWRACRVVIDVELSCGRMGMEEAVELLLREVMMTGEMARAEVRRYAYTPGYQLSYLYGRHLLLELRERQRRREGHAFDLRRFHDRLLSASALPAALWERLF